MSTNPNLAGFSSECRLDIPELDQQHEDFFSRLDRIAEVVPDLYSPPDEEDADALVDVMGELRENALLHFRTEEELMREANYPGCDEQEQAHGRFIADLTRMEGDILNGLAVAPIQVLNFLHDRWRGHLLSMDRRFGEFLKENRA